MKQNLVEREQQVICAISTPPGYGGISVIRVSGAGSDRVVQKIAPFLPSKPESHRIYYGHLVSPSTHQKIDEVLILSFEEGKSFTGEQVLEIHGHGNPLLADQILRELVSSGARIADRGEFTYRAFMNQRLDLVQAESVLDLIQSQSQSATQMALRQLQGELSKDLEDIEARILKLLAHLEASIDFSTENLEIISSQQVQTQLKEIEQKLISRVSEYQKGKMIREGVVIAFAGRPNVGKSSLLNLLVEDDRAIVTEVPGTTRDLIESSLIYQGQKIVLVDTAGIRSDAIDQVEKIGIQKSLSAHQKADFIYLILDANQGLTSEDEALLLTVSPKNLYILANKEDLIQSAQRELLEKQLLQSKFFKTHGLGPQWLTSRLAFITTLDKKVRDLLLQKLMQEMSLNQTEDRALLSQARHFEKLSEGLEKIQQVQRMVQENHGAEFLSQDLKWALVCVQEVLGKHYDDQIVDKIFKEFCLGK